MTAGRVHLRQQWGRWRRLRECNGGFFGPPFWYVQESYKFFLVETLRVCDVLICGRIRCSAPLPVILNFSVLPLLYLCLYSKWCGGFIDILLGNIMIKSVNRCITHDIFNGKAFSLSSGTTFVRPSLQLWWQYSDPLPPTDHGLRSSLYHMCN